LLAVGLAAGAGYQRDLSLDELKPRWATGASRFVDVRGTQVHYRDEGQGETIVLLHGTAASLHTWDAWAEELAHHYRVVRLDLPGFGLTGPDGAHDYTAAHYVDFLTGFLAKVGVERFHLVGNSLGGRVAWELALALPARVQSLVLIDAGGYPLDPKSIVFKLARTPGLSRLVRWITPRSLVRKTLLEVYGDDRKVTDALVDRYFDLQRRAGNREAFIERARTPNVDDTAALPGIHCPTLVLWGELDAWLPVEHARRFQKDIPGAELIVYPGVGHMPMEESPAASVADTERFLARVPR
jgi:pimeloyl-ACP methyl ester carboxylesterase